METGVPGTMAERCVPFMMVLEARVLGRWILFRWTYRWPRVNVLRIVENFVCTGSLQQLTLGVLVLAPFLALSSMDMYVLCSTTYMYNNPVETENRDNTICTGTSTYQTTVYGLLPYKDDSSLGCMMYM